MVHLTELVFEEHQEMVNILHSYWSSLDCGHVVRREQCEKGNVSFSSSLAPTTCVTLDMLHDLSDFWFPPLSNGDELPS